MTIDDKVEADEFGALIAPETIRIERLLPGHRERVWRYLTEPDLRRRWLASGAFELHPGGAVELLFRNDELVPGDDPAPARFAAEGGEVRLRGLVTDCEPMRRLAYTWGTGEDASEVRFDLAEEGAKVRLTVTHRRLSGRSLRVMVSAGWHTHLDILVAILEGRAPDGFWRRFVPLERVYEARLPQD